LSGDGKVLLATLGGLPFVERIGGHRRCAKAPRNIPDMATVSARVDRLGLRLRSVLGAVRHKAPLQKIKVKFATSRAAAHHHRLL
jgi:hypothetical protein